MRLSTASPVLSVALLGAALLACKKDEAKTEPTATASAPAPEVATASSPATASATAEAPTSATAEASAAPTTTPTPESGAASTKSGTAPASSAGKPAVTASFTPCCNALAAAHKKGGPHKARYQSAAAVCSGLATAVKKGTASLAGARTTLRAQLQGVPVPSGC